MKWLTPNNFSPRALTHFGVRGEKLLGWVLAFKNLQTRRRVVSAEEGQDSFSWPTTPDAASLQLLIDGWELA